MENIIIDNSKKSLDRNKKWKNPGAKLYDRLLDAYSYPKGENGDLPDSAQKLDEEIKNGNYIQWNDLVKEAYLVAPVKEIKNSPYGRTPFSRSGCKYPHHIIKDGKLVVSLAGLRSAYITARNQGCFDPNVSERPSYWKELTSHINRHFKELELKPEWRYGEFYLTENDQLIIDQNFNDIYDFLYESSNGNINIPYDDSYEEFNEASHRKLKFDFRLGYDLKTGHQLKIVYSLDNIDITNVGDFYNQYSGDPDHEGYLNHVKKNIKYKGNGDHESKGQKVLAIVDMVTNKRIKESIIIPSVLLDDLIEGTKKKSLSIDDLNEIKKEAKNKSLKFYKIKEGEIDNISSYKSTKWQKENIVNSTELVGDTDNSRDNRFRSISKDEVYKNLRGHKNDTFGVDKKMFSASENWHPMIKVNPSKKEFIYELDWKIKLIGWNIEDVRNAYDHGKFNNQNVFTDDEIFQIIINSENKKKYLEQLKQKLEMNKEYPFDQNIVKKVRRWPRLTVDNSNVIRKIMKNFYEATLSKYYGLRQAQLFQEHGVSIPRDSRFLYDESIINENENYENYMVEHCHYVIFEDYDQENFDIYMENKRLDSLGVNSDFRLSMNHISANEIEKDKEYLNESINESFQWMEDVFNGTNKEFNEKSHDTLKYVYRIGFDLDTCQQVAIKFKFDSGNLLTNTNEKIRKDAIYIYNKYSDDHINDEMEKSIDDNFEQAIKNLKKDVKKTGHIDFLSKNMLVDSIFTRDGKSLQKVRFIGYFNPNLINFFESFIRFEMNDKKDVTFKEMINHKKFKESIKSFFKSFDKPYEIYEVGKYGGAGKFKTTKLLWDKDWLYSYRFTPILRGYNKKGRSNDFYDARDYINNSGLNKFEDRKVKDFIKEVNEAFSMIFEYADSSNSGSHFYNIINIPEFYEAEIKTLEEDYIFAIEDYIINEDFYNSEKYKYILEHSDAFVSLRIHRSPGLTYEHKDLINDDYVNDKIIGREVFESSDNPYYFCKTPKDLLKWMDSIQYGWIDHKGNIQGTGIEDDERDFYKYYRLQSPKKLAQSRVGVCWDQTELERRWFKKNWDQNRFINVYIEIDDKKGNPTHTFLVFKDDDNYYWFEHSWGIYKGIHKYDTLKDLLYDVVTKHQKFNNDIRSGVIVTFSKYDNKPTYGSTCQEFMDWARGCKSIDMADIQDDEIFNEYNGIKYNTTGLDGDNIEWLSEYLKEEGEDILFEESKKKESSSEDKEEVNKNGNNRKTLYIEFIKYAQSIKEKNTFGTIFDKDAFKKKYKFVPNEMRYFYRLANPILCVLEDDLCFFNVSELKKLNKKLHIDTDEMLMFAANTKEYIVFYNKNKAIYKAKDDSGEFKLGKKIADSFDLYIQSLIGNKDYLNGN